VISVTVVDSIDSAGGFGTAASAVVAAANKVASAINDAMRRRMSTLLCPTAILTNRRCEVV
jgi:hypothetical protein